MANLGMFAIHNIGLWKILRKNPSVHGDDSKILLNTTRDTKLSLSRYIMAKHEMFCISLLSIESGLD